MGGDWASNPSNTIQSLTPEMKSERIFTRASFDITDHFNVFGQFSWAGTNSLGYNEPNFYFGNLIVKSDNAFIPAEIRTRLNALGLTQFNMGTLNGDLPDWGNKTDRDTKRYVVGASGDFDALSSNWNWNAYYQRGTTDGQFQAVGVSNRVRYMQAIDAVRDPNTGAIVVSFLAGRSVEWLRAVQLVWHGRQFAGGDQLHRAVCADPESQADAGRLVRSDLR